MSRSPAAERPTDPAEGAAPAEWPAVGEHDRRLLENVHPPDWENPRAAEKYQLAVVGGGTGGLVTAAIAVALGARVALVERRLMGGDCLNVGCVPSKALIRAARGWKAAREAAERFGGPAASGEGDFGAAMERMRRIRADISGHDSARRFRELGVDVFLGHATFTAPDRLQVNGQTLRFHRAVIGTGSRPAAPPIPGLHDAGYLTNESVFSLTKLPPRLVVIGAGAIGCELAQSFARFGSKVTLLEVADRILLRDDPDGAALIARAMEADGVEIVCGANVERVERSGEGAVVSFSMGSDSRTVVADAILIAAGRAANVDGLGLEAAGVEHDRRGVRVDERLRTSNRRIFAVGDVAGRHQFTHVADAHARLVVRNALFFGRGSVDDLLVPWVTYTSPELAHIGMTHDEAARQSDDVETLTVELSAVDRARIDGEEHGFLRLHLESGSDRILGATLVGEGAGDLLAPVAQAITLGIGLERLGDVILPYPTRAEIVRKAADQYRRRKLTPLAKRAFGAYFGIMG